MDAEERRYRIVPIDAMMFDSIIKGKARIDLNGFPEDAQCLGIRYDSSRDALFALYSHESFESQEIGSLIPIDTRPMAIRNREGE